MSKYRGMSTGVKVILGVLVGVISVAAIFMLVSLILANVHDKTLITEWKSWFDFAKESTETLKDVSSHIFIK